MLDQPKQYLRTGNAYAAPWTLSSFATHNTRLPSGHPEGMLEAFANIYRNFAQTLSARIEGRVPAAESLDFPSVEDGVRGMAFIDCVTLSSRNNARWTEFGRTDPDE